MSEEIHREENDYDNEKNVEKNVSTQLIMNLM